MSTTTTTTTEQRVVEIPLDQLHESPFNPRRTFLDLEDLAASIKAEGRIHQPLKVRPIRPNPLRDDIVDGYEIVFGHRRFRAAALAGLITAPCIVEPMNDAMARSAQIAENLQRKDVHPIEEAEGFAAMMKDDGLSADELATLVGKSRSHVYGRLKLLQACAPIRDACLAGEIGSEVALLIARLRTDKLQQKALGYIRGKYIDLQDGGAKSFRQIRALLNERFTLDLAGALFTPTDAGLLPEAGSCTGCMKRSGNAPEFQDLVAEGKEESVDVDAMTDEQYEAHLQRIQHSYRDRNRGARFTGPDICTDPDCFAAKKKAHLLQEATRLRAEGKVVVDGGKAMAAITADGKVKGAYVALADVRKALQKIKGEKPATVLIQDPRGGKLFEAVKREDLVAAGVSDKAQPPKNAGSSGSDWRAEQKAREAAASAEQIKRNRLLDVVRAAARQRPRTIEELRLAVLAAVDNGSNSHYVVELQGFKSERQLALAINSMTGDELALTLLDLAMCGDPGVYSYDVNDRTPLLSAFAALYGIDVKAAREGLVQTPEPTLEPAAAESASTPPTAARAQGKAARGAAAKKKPAGKAAGGGKKKAGPAAREVNDDAGSAGEVDRDPNTSDMFEEDHA